MAFLQKFFNSNKRRQNNSKSSYNDTRIDWKKPQFDDKSIRLVLFRDDHSNNSGRKLLFDSKNIAKLDEKTSRWCKGQGHKLVPVSEGHVQQNTPLQKYVYEHGKTSSDSKMLEEIMFGADGVAYKGTSLKVHVTRTPSQLMLTKVFVPEKPKRLSTLDGEESNSFTGVLETPNSRSSTADSKHSYGRSIPMDVPSPKQPWIQGLQSIDVLDEDSGLASFTSSGSVYAPSPSSLSDSCNSLNMEKRWNRSLWMSLDSGLTRRHSQQDVAELASPHRSRKLKFAIAIIFDTTEEQKDHSNRLFESFFFSHIALLESHLEHLRQGVEKGYYSGGGRGSHFYPIVIETFMKFKQGIIDLYTAPRLGEPVWLNMMSYPNYRYVLCEKFLKEFVALVGKFDNKNNRFFMSTLVTAVLTHHLAWVPTVMPAGGYPSGSYLEKHSAKWVDTLAKSHPYNPLWAQLGDLYGAIGFPLKLSRTVIVGKKADLVKKILFVLSYFIRCSDILESVEVGCLETFLQKLDFTVESPVDSAKTLSVCTPVEDDDLTSSPTPVNTNQFNFDSSKYNPLCVDSLLSNKGSRISAEAGDGQQNKSNVVQVCDMCKKNSENKVGKSVFYVSNEPCSCDTVKGVNSFDHLSVSSLNSDRRSEIQKKKESLKLGIKIPSQKSLPDNSDPGTGLACRLSSADIVEDTKIERVELGRNCATANKVPILADGKICVPGYDFKIPENVDRVLTTDEMRKIFRGQGSNSMFDEYFENGSEVKTIDEVKEKPLSNSTSKIRFAQDDNLDSRPEDEQCKTPSMPDLTPCGQGDSEQDERLRLGSLDQTYCKQRKSSLSRQMSESAKQSKCGPARCRSVTPTEYGKRRHVSSASSIDFDILDPRHYCHELPMPSLDQETSCSSQKDFDKNFGRSLLGDYSDRYMSDFVLHGTSDKNYKEKLIKDIKMAIQCSVLDEPIAEAVVVVADTDDFTVNTYSSQQIDRTATFPQTCVASHLIINLIESVVNMSKLKMSPEFCMMHLEDKLQEIYFKSKVMAEYLKKSKNVPDLLNIFGFDRSDLPLLVAIAGTHTPNFPLVCLP